MTRPPILLGLLERLADAKAAATIVGDRTPAGGRPAAVLILFWWDAEAAASEGGDLGGLRLALIEKSAQLRSHAGQLAFPGGSLEPGEDAITAALREAQEEVGVHPSTVDVLGLLPAAHVEASGFDVRSVVGWWPQPGRLEPADSFEVAAVHEVAVGRLVDPSNRLTWQHPSGHSGPAFVVDDLFVWGFTGHLVDGLLRLAGWEKEWDADRTASIPPRFLRTRRDTGR